MRHGAWMGSAIRAPYLIGRLLGVRRTPQRVRPNAGDEGIRY